MKEAEDDKYEELEEEALGSTKKLAQSKGTYLHTATRICKM